jgi:hypothetical protein
MGGTTPKGLTAGKIVLLAITYIVIGLCVGWLIVLLDTSAVSSLLTALAAIAAAGFGLSKATALVSKESEKTPAVVVATAFLILGVAVGVPLGHHWKPHLISSPLTNAVEAEVRAWHDLTEVSEDTLAACFLGLRVSGLLNPGTGGLSVAKVTTRADLPAACSTLAAPRPTSGGGGGR